MFVSLCLSLCVCLSECQRYETWTKRTEHFEFKVDVRVPLENGVLKSDLDLCFSATVWPKKPINFLCFSYGRIGVIPCI